MTTYSSKEYEFFIGIDVDKNSFSFTVKDQDNFTKSKKIPSSPEQMYNYIENHFANKKIVCAYEAGPTGFGLHDYFSSKQMPCILVSPLNIPKQSNQVVKNNRIDSEKIAQYLKSGDVKAVRVPQGIWRQLRHLTSIRSNYASDRKRNKLRIQSLLLQESLYPQLQETHSKWSKRHIKELRSISCNPSVRQRLDALLNDLEYSRNNLLTTHKQIKTFCESNLEIKKYLGYLQSIPGIGFVIAVTVLGEIGDPAYLQNLKELGCFCGLVPCEHSTGDRIIRTGISHTGNKTLRFMLIEAAWAAIRKDTQLRQFYDRIRSRNVSYASGKKAITAVARKLTLIIYRILKDQRNYISFQNQAAVSSKERQPRVYKLQG